MTDQPDGKTSSVEFASRLYFAAVFACGVFAVAVFLGTVGPFQSHMMLAVDLSMLSAYACCGVGLVLGAHCFVTKTRAPRILVRSLVLSAVLFLFQMCLPQLAVIGPRIRPPWLPM